jgi:hypothetical protein
VQCHGHYFGESDCGDRESDGWLDVILATARYLLGLDAQKVGGVLVKLV